MSMNNSNFTFYNFSMELECQGISLRKTFEGDRRRGREGQCLSDKGSDPRASCSCATSLPPGALS